VPVKTWVAARRRPACIRLHPGRPSQSHHRNARFQNSRTRPSSLRRDGYSVRATDCQRVAAMTDTPGIATQARLSESRTTPPSSARRRSS
jgi:hypothetical protein